MKHDHRSRAGTLVLQLWGTDYANDPLSPNARHSETGGIHQVEMEHRLQVQLTEKYESFRIKNMNMFKTFPAIWTLSVTISLCNYLEHLKSTCLDSSLCIKDMACLID